MSYSCGGGGYESPLARDPNKVAIDVRERWVSVDRARDIYGVVLGVDGLPDFAATEQRRTELAA